MPATLDPLSLPTRILYRNLLTEVVDIHYRWNLFRRLYDTDQETFDLLMQSAQYFFTVLYFDLLNAIALAFGRLLDRAESRQSKNASMQQLFDLLGGIDPKLSDRLGEHLDRARKHAEPIMEWRHKIAAHKDYKHALTRKPNIGYNPSDVESALQELDLFVNEFEEFFSDPPYVQDSNISDDEKTKRANDFQKYKIEVTHFNDIVFIRGNPNDLVTLLKDAQSSHLQT